MRIGRRHPVGKFVHVGLAYHHCSGSSQTFNYGSIVFRNVVSEELRPTSGSDSPCAKNVLNSDRDAVQWAAILPIKQFLVSLLGLALRQLSGDGDEGFQLGIERIDSAQ